MEPLPQARFLASVVSAPNEEVESDGKNECPGHSLRLRLSLPPRGLGQTGKRHAIVACRRMGVRATENGRVEGWKIGVMEGWNGEWGKGWMGWEFPLTLPSPSWRGNGIVRLHVEGANNLRDIIVR